ncbi:MAG: FHA domain-containing protein [Lentisphaeraceae bacterium]|nr:FHA domain-containing protein [Lentisphaeraceae bacterium]
MDHDDKYNCSLCNAVNSKGSSICKQCGEQTTVAVFKSLGKGNVPVDFIWPLYPYDAIIGSGTSNDIIIPSNRLARQHCQINYVNGSFFLQRTCEENPVFLNNRIVKINLAEKVQDGATIRLGLDELKMHYFNLTPKQLERKTEVEKVQYKLEKEHSENPVTKRLILMLGYLQELHSSANLEELLRSSVDALLKITGLDRGYAFIFEENNGEPNLKEIVSRQPDGRDYETEAYTISQSLINKVLEDNDTIVIENADREPGLGDSISNFSIKSVVCMPLYKKDNSSSEKHTVGLLYADAVNSSIKMPAHIHTTLQMLSQLVASNLDRCTTFSAAVEESNSFQQYFSTLASEFDTIRENLITINLNMKNNDSQENTKALAPYLHGEKDKLMNIIHSVIEASEEL